LDLRIEGPGRTALAAVVLGLAACGALAIGQVTLHRVRERQALVPAPPVPKAPPLVQLRPTREELLQGEALLSALRKGGNVIYFRHFHSDHRTWHLDPIRDRHGEMSVADFQATCDQQRPLTDYGRMRAADVGRAMARLQIPVETVLSSPYCRVMDSARLLSGREPTATLKLVYDGGTRTLDQSLRDAGAIFTTPPPAGRNTLVVAHRSVTDGFGGPRMSEGQAYVLRPLADGGFEMIGRVHDTDWLEGLHDVRYLGARALNEPLEDPTQGPKPAR
jgi:hypothetical protein